MGMLLGVWPSGPTSGVVGDREIDAARLALIRVRITTFGMVIGGLFMVMAVCAGALRLRAGEPIGGMTVLTFVAGAFFLGVQRWKGGWNGRARALTLRGLVGRASLLVIGGSLLALATSQVFAGVLTELARSGGIIGPNGRLGIFWPVLGWTAVLHVVASILIPWTPREAFRPMLVIGVFFMIVIAAESALNLSRAGGSVLFSPLAAVLVLAAGLPGVAVSALRTTRLRGVVEMAVLRTGYGDMQRELALARRLHERHLPRSIDEGPVRVAYSYEPMRHIGGDFLEILARSDGGVTIVVLDVTGHGIAAALAVNRLHSELRRLRAASGDVSPGEIISSLNAYVHHTLADEGVFATALACRIDPARARVTIANGGHPPALLLHRGGGSERIDSTAMMLGPLSPEEFEVEEVERPLGVGAWLIVCTDGALECADAQERQLGLSGFERVVEVSAKGAREAGELARLIHRGVVEYRDGPPSDDTLVVVARVGG